MCSQLDMHQNQYLYWIIGFAVLVLRRYWCIDRIETWWYWCWQYLDLVVLVLIYYWYWLSWVTIRIGIGSLDTWQESFGIGYDICCFRYQLQGRSFPQLFMKNISNIRNLWSFSKNEIHGWNSQNMQNSVS